jgi:parallel beta-helix repeat protein
MYHSGTVLSIATAFLVIAGGFGVHSSWAAPVQAPAAFGPPQVPDESLPTVIPGHLGALGDAHPAGPTEVGLARPGVSGPLTIIYPNGTISNHSAPIAVLGNVYSITGNFTGGLALERNHTAIHGNGWTIRTDAALTVGVVLFDVSEVDVRDLSVQGGQEGFEVVGSAEARVTSDRVDATSSWGVNVLDSVNISVADNTLVNTSGIEAQQVSGFNVSGNLVSNTSFLPVFIQYCNLVSVFGNHVAGDFGSVDVSYSSDASVAQNTMGPGSFGFYGYGDSGLTLNHNSFNATTTAEYVASSSGIVDSYDHGGNISIAFSLYSDTNATFSFEDFPRVTYTGVSLSTSSLITVEDSNFTNASVEGILIDQGENTTLTALNLSGFGYAGVEANDSSALNFSGVNASNSLTFGAMAFGLNSDEIVALWNCTGDSASYGVDADETGDLLIQDSSFSHSAFGYDAVVVVGGRDVTLRSDDLTYSSAEAAYFQSTTGVLIEASNLSNASYNGLILEECAEVVVEGNLALGERSDSFADWSSIAVTFSDNVGGNSTGPYGYGFDVIDGAGVLLENNTASNTNVSFSLQDSSYLEAIGNDGAHAYEGLYLYNLDESTISGNSFDNDTYAFFVDENFEVLIYHNSFVNDSGWQNIASLQIIGWDDGYPGGGNFWGNLTGPDDYSGPGQNLTGPDGIVDVPMEINATNVDHYPLARPWAGATVTFSATGLAPGTVWSVNISGTVLSGSTPTLVYEVPGAANQTLSYSLPSVAGYAVIGPGAGAVNYNGTDSVVLVAFTAVTYRVTFAESGLVAGTAWSVSVAARDLLTSSPYANVSLANGSYAFTVAQVAGYALTTPSGNISVDSAGIVVAVQFVQIVHPVVYQNQTTYSNHTVYRYGTNNSSGPPGGGSKTTGGTTTSGYAASTVDALVAGLVLLAVLAALGFALWARGRGRTPTPAAQPWSPPTTPPASPPSVAGVGPVAVPPSPTKAVASPDWKEDP